MPKEQSYQTKIIKAVEKLGGVAVNGTYYKKGTADLICGYPLVIKSKLGNSFKDNTILLHLHIEVKTKEAYDSLFRNHITENLEDGLYHVNPDFKGREVLQAHKLNEVRKRGGLALFAYDIKQVEAYINANT